MSMDFPHDEPEPAKRGRKRRRFRRVPIRVLVPNAVTLLALGAGMSAIRMAFEGRFEVAVGMILLAAVLDGLDGRIARALKGTSRFGAELDSFADFISFGVAPAVVLFTWSLNLYKGLGWIIVLSLAISAALRLARFNVALDDPDTPAWSANYFTGVPAPAGAGIALLPMYLSFLTGFSGADAALWLLVYVPFAGFLMVSRLPTYSGKMIGQRIRRDIVLPVLMLIVIFTALLLSYPWLVLSVLTLTYMASIPLSMRRYKEQLDASGGGDQAATGGDAGKADADDAP